jgi:hypothetical protein
MAAIMETSTPPLVIQPSLIAQRRQALGYTRALGVGTALFLPAWAWVGLDRWTYASSAASFFGNSEALYFCFYAILLMLPYSRVRSTRMWRWAFGILAAASMMFIFVMVFDVMFSYMTTAAVGQPTPPPILNSALIFICILQIPTILFSRHPDWLD